MGSEKGMDRKEGIEDMEDREGEVEYTWTLSNGLQRGAITVYYELFEHYEEWIRQHHKELGTNEVFDHKTVVVQYINEGNTIAGIFEAVEVPEINGVIINITERLWTIKTVSMQPQDNMIIVVTFVGKEIILMTMNEYIMVRHVLGSLLENHNREESQQ